MAVPHFIAAGLVESFDIGFLDGFVGPDVPTGDTFALSPIARCFGYGLWGVVQEKLQRRVMQHLLAPG